MYQDHKTTLAVYFQVMFVSTCGEERSTVSLESASGSHDHGLSGICPSYENVQFCNISLNAHQTCSCLATRAASRFRSLSKVLTTIYREVTVENLTRDPEIGRRE